MIRNVLFDLDDTLLDFRRAERLALTKTLSHLGIEPGEPMLARYSALNLAQWKLLEQGKLSRDEVKQRRFQLLFNEIGIDYPACHAAAYYEDALKIGHYFVDGAETVLKELSGVCRLYLVSNGTADVQRSRIASADIGKYFDNIFISQEIGSNKPNGGFFTFCFAHIPEFRKSETVIVGDSLSSDIQGGRNAGITTVWFNPYGAENTSGIVPDREIYQLCELPSLLEAM